MPASLSSSPRRRADQDLTLTYGGLAEGFRYDPASQVTTILHQLTATNSQINEADYLYNGVGNRTQLTDRRGAQTFGYDTLDRLTSASHPLLGTPQAFAYDAVGNRTTGGSVVNAIVMTLSDIPNTDRQGGTMAKWTAREVEASEASETTWSR